MKSKILILSTIVLTSLVLFTKCTTEQTNGNPLPADTAKNTAENDLQSRVERGAYLVNGIGCDDCHSPKKMGPQGPEIDPGRRLSGHPADRELPKIADPTVAKDYALFTMDLTAAVGPWGTSYAANLTPDESGIGTWTEAQFVKAIKEGKLKGLDNTRPLLPPMPWPMYRNLSDEDLKAIFAYLKTLKPVKNVVPAPISPAG